MACLQLMAYSDQTNFSIWQAKKQSCAPARESTRRLTGSAGVLSSYSQYVQKIGGWPRLLDPKPDPKPKLVGLIGLPSCRGTDLQAADALID